MNHFSYGVILLLLFVNARADWAEFTVSYDCDTDSKVFALNPIVNSSGSFSEYESGEELPKGIDQSLSCHLSHNVNIDLNYTAVGPQASGMCRGIGYTSINSLKINNFHAYGWLEINSGCFFEDTLISFKVRILESDIYIDKCVAKEWDLDSGYIGKNCTSEKYSPSKTVE